MRSRRRWMRRRGGICSDTLRPKHPDPTRHRVTGSVCQPAARPHCEDRDRLIGAETRVDGWVKSTNSRDRQDKVSLRVFDCTSDHLMGAMDDATLTPGAGAP